MKYVNNKLELDIIDDKKTIIKFLEKPNIMKKNLFYKKKKEESLRR